MTSSYVFKCVYNGAFETLCNEDEQAIRRCFEGVAGDPLDGVKTWRQ